MRYIFSGQQILREERMILANICPLLLRTLGDARTDAATAANISAFMAPRFGRSLTIFSWGLLMPLTGPALSTQKYPTCLYSITPIRSLQRNSNEAPKEK